MKKLALFLIFFPTWVLGENIKLSCNLNLTDKYSTGHSEKTNITDIIEVSIYRNGKFIIPEVLGSVRAKAGENNTDYSAVDLSDANKWSISAKYSGRSDKISSGETSFVIDRNTGFILYDQLTNFADGAWMRTYGNGNCQKIDTSKKKF